MRALNLVLALACAIGLAHAAALVGLHVLLDPNEGWNAYNAAAAMSGAPLYPHGLFFDNYPPLSFYAVGALGGDPIVAGRVVSLLALLAVAAAIFAAARTMGAGRPAALFAALWFAGGMLVFTDYVGMDDPQLLGHAVAMLGLLLLLRGSLAGAALAMTLALFVKHNLVALPAAAALWLAVTDRRGAMRFVATGVASGLLGLLAFRAVTGIGLLGQLSSPRLFSFALLADGVAAWLAWGGTAMLAAAALLLVRRDDKDVLFVALYALCGVAAGTFFSGGAGVDTNAWFDAAIACALGMALALERLPIKAWHGPALAGAILLPLLVGLASYDDWPGAADAADGDIAFLKAQKGPALCETLALCYWAGKPVEVDVFNLGQAYATGARGDDALVGLIETRRFAAMEFDSLDDFALGARVKRAALANYRIDHADDAGVFLVRRARP